MNPFLLSWPFNFFPIFSPSQGGRLSHHPLPSPPPGNCITLSVTPIKRHRQPTSFLIVRLARDGLALSADCPGLTDSPLRIHYPLGRRLNVTYIKQAGEGGSKSGWKRDSTHTIVRLMSEKLREAAKRGRAPSSRRGNKNNAIPRLMASFCATPDLRKKEAAKPLLLANVPLPSLSAIL